MTTSLRARIDLYGWVSLGYSGFFCGLVVGDSLTQTGRLAALGMGVLGVIATLKAFLALGPTPNLRENVLHFWEEMIGAKKKLDSFIVSSSLVAITLGFATMTTNPASDVWLGITNGLRNAVYLLVFGFAWRLSIGWRMTLFGVWVFLDLLLYYRMGGSVEPPENGNGLMTLVVGIFVGWALLVAQDIMDAWSNDHSSE